MKKKTSRRRIEVDIDELDRIIDTAMRGPLNEAEGRTLRAAVHAMAERLVRCRNTEKTSAVLEPKTSPAAVDTPPEPEKPSSAGHGRNRADAFTGADKVAIAFQASLRRLLSGMRRRKSIPPEGTRDADPRYRAGAAAGDCVRDGTAAL